MVITSPYLRARETWRIAAEASGLDFPPPTTDDRLVDRLLGDLEMMTRAAVADQFPDEAGRRRAAGEYEYRPPQGESFADIEVRLTAFLDDLNRDHAGERVVVVAHDAVVLMMRAVIEKLTWEQTLAAEADRQRPQRVDHPLRRHLRNLVMDRYNSVDHLEPADPPA